MNNRIPSPRWLALAACLATFTGSAIAQSSESDNHRVNTSIKTTGAVQLESEPLAPVEESRPRSVDATPRAKLVNAAPTINLTNRIDQLLLTAMQSHVGASYHFNRTGPETFDCSGFVWRAFQDIGFNFQRGPARSYWATFDVPAANEQFKFGTLVFFSNLSHVGIVVDEKGFYHSARHGGVMYSPFNDYWLSRIDGFRRVPTQTLPTTVVSTKQSKPVTPAVVIENNEP